MVHGPEVQVSVVIPTRSRPALVLRAVESALAQTLREIEVIVVIDGPDPETAAALAAVGDPRLRVVHREASGGAPTARNTGVEHARAPWVAMLDDDDEWLPGKLAAQVDVAATVKAPLPVVACRLYMRTPRADLLIPRRMPATGEPISEYLTVRKGLFHGEGFIQTSMIMAPTELFRRVPFTPGLRRFQELDWTLRCLEIEGVELVYADEPLLIWYVDENRPRVSSTAPWRESLVWLDETRDRVTPRAYAALAMSVVGSTAATTHSPRLFLDLLRRARRHGRPGLIDYLTFLQVWLVPSGARRVVRDFFLRRRRRDGVGYAALDQHDHPLAPAGDRTGDQTDDDGKAQAVSR